MARMTRMVQSMLDNTPSQPDPNVESQCVYCGTPLTAATLTMDHVIPTSRGGSNLPVNKAPACRQCNFDKAQLTAEEYLRMRDNPEEMEAYKRALHDEMSTRGQQRHDELHRPLGIPKKPPPRTFAQADAERRQGSRRAREKAKAGECIADLGFSCHCPICDPQAHASLTQNLRERARIRFEHEVTDREIRG